MNRLKKFFVSAVAVTLALAVAAPYLLKTVNSLMIKDTAVDVSSYSADSQSAVELEKGDFVLLGSYLGEPILWQVLKKESDGRVLLMTHYVIMFKAFDAAGKSEAFHKSDSEKYGSADWENSTLCQWLNSDEENVGYSHCAPNEKSVFGGYNAYAEEKGFLHKDNFDESLKQLISDEGVFVPDKKMLECVSKREKSATKSALLSNESPYVASGVRSVWYWTSLPVNSNNVSVTTVTSSGGYYKALAYDGLTGVAPALYLKSATVFAGGYGTFDNPYLVEGGAEK